MEMTNRKLLLVVLILMLGWFTFSFIWGERIKENNGLGWDGKIYAAATLNPVDFITKIGVNKYHASRLLPSIAVHYSAKLFNYQLGTSLMTPKAVINAFVVYNSVLILISLFLLYLIAMHFKWHSPVFLIAIIALFLNFPVLKLSVYYPTQTDITAFMLILLMLYLYLKDKQITLFVVSLCSCFVWPTMIYMALPLIVYNVRKYEYQKYVHSYILDIATVLFAVILAAGVLYDHYFKISKFPNGATPVNDNLIILSIILFIMYIVLILRPFVDLQYLKSNLFHSMRLKGVIISLIFVAIVKLIVAKLSTNSYSVSPLYQFRLMGQGSIVNPLVNVVAHVSYFGPIVILTLFFWQNVISIIKQYGLGLMFVTLFCALLSVDSESRHLMAAWPIFAIFTCEVLNRRGITWRLAYSLLCVGLLTSRFWLVINSKEMWTGPYIEFPYQMFFMNIGPWLSNSMYLVFAIITLILTIWLFISVQRNVGFDMKNPEKPCSNSSQ
jgi:hypothetical protein